MMVKKTIGPMMSGAKMKKAGAKKRNGELALTLDNPHMPVNIIHRPSVCVFRIVTRCHT